MYCHAVNGSSHLLQARSVQTNAYDCGMWTILYMFSVLRGYDVMANVREEDMPEVRRCILCCIYNLRPN